jgi:non-specific serine/threonine protein kinase
VPQAVATVLGIHEQSDRPVFATLSERLRDRKVLVLLDNCEHVMAASAELATRLLHACPNLRVLATSRVVLGVSGETTWPVPALPLIP